LKDTIKGKKIKRMRDDYEFEGEKEKKPKRKKNKNIIYTKN
jgi:hypothetical protein